MEIELRAVRPASISSSRARAAIAQERRLEPEHWARGGSRDRSVDLGGHLQAPDDVACGDGDGGEGTGEATRARPARRSRDTTPSRRCLHGAGISSSSTCCFRFVLLRAREGDRSSNPPLKQYQTNRVSPLVKTQDDASQWLIGFSIYMYHIYK